MQACLVMRFDTSDIAALRHTIMKRGKRLATLLSFDSEPSEKPGMRPEEGLRLALDQVERQRRLLDAGDERFGRCDRCGEDLGIVHLREIPWADRCAKHAAS